MRCTIYTHALYLLDCVLRLKTEKKQQSLNYNLGSTGSPSNNLRQPLKTSRESSYESVSGFLPNVRISFGVRFRVYKIRVGVGFSVRVGVRVTGGFF